MTAQNPPRRYQRNLDSTLTTSEMGTRRVTKKPLTSSSVGVTTTPALSARTAVSGNRTRATTPTDLSPVSHEAATRAVPYTQTNAIPVFTHGER